MILRHFRYTIICIAFMLGYGRTVQAQGGSSGNAVIADATPKDVLKGEHTEVRVYDFEGLQHLLKVQNDTTYVVNFWATWCKPCVEELPHFEAINEQYSGKNVEVVLVSLDFPSRARELLIPFIKKRGIKSHVVLLDDPKQNTWIPKVDETWSGALPATLIFNRNKKAFYEKSFTFKELESELLSFIN